ncbi:hypothetical protein K9B33_20875 [Sphingobium sp. 3R8]|uniref:DUF6950 family protein n=1 Tax=Sphingobium sp. 3R8 TaxID=2874921 RepID=UPI001CCD2835|nr:hypothetical protein [Sphingobium sp. 3R8]MBZ9649992.1 hypothetical protein [Sphingobium sp. 3R8]
MNDMLRRQAALEQTVAKYRGRSLDFKTADCVRMARFHLLKMGHKPPALPRYQSAVGAVRAMKAAGGLVAVFDSILPRIAPAMMLDGDIAVVAGEGGDAALIRAGYKFMGWHQDHDQAVNMTVDLANVTAAWRA